MDIINKINEVLGEANNPKWIIMNASGWAGRTKMSVEDIIKLNDTDAKYSIIVAEKEEGFGKPWKKVFVLGYGSADGYEGETTYIVDTGRGFGGRGRIRTENYITIENSEIVDRANDIGLNERRSFWVFK